MGREFITTYQDGTDVEQAFRTAREEAEEEFGSPSNRGYTGTIAEKDEYKVVTDTSMSQDRAETYAYQQMEDGLYPESSDPAGAIPVHKTPSTGGAPQHCGWLFFGWARC
ncbi:hypothetical protein [Streptomyces sp. NBC_00582]|uniref:hypothetical protein n=1 Tax=Streptomyces sp. NBC_00582 TaxID=2975783 RepID=UPI002E801A05|nr:hypothetical protein [Streptomyces sp. NBC_00582]WUB68599.1 hypothetical protein OG852_50775 [Streptomyces sp. NBC_00582]